MSGRDHNVISQAVWTGGAASAGCPLGGQTGKLNPEYRAPLGSRFPLAHLRTCVTPRPAASGPVPAGAQGRPAASSAPPFVSCAFFPSRPSYFRGNTDLNGRNPTFVGKR